MEMESLPFNFIHLCIMHASQISSKQTAAEDATSFNPISLWTKLTLYHQSQQIANKSFHSLSVSGTAATSSNTTTLQGKTCL